MISTVSIRRCFISLLGLAMPLAWADGTLTHMSGPVSILRADGKTMPGAPGAKAYVGDTILTGAKGFVRMEMTDGGEFVLRPDSRLKIDAYKFNQTKPAEDNLAFSMIKGGLRTVTGLIGKRGNKDAYAVKTDTVTIGIRGTQYDMRVCQGNCGALPNGTYVAVRFGSVMTSNAQGGLAVAAGQTAYVAPAASPVMLPRDPGIGFTPPPVIPKLDEKKKQQTSPTAAEQKPGATAGQTSQGGNSDAPGKKDASGKSDGGKSDSGTKNESGTKTESGAKSDPGTKSDAASKTDSGSGKSGGKAEGGASAENQGGSSTGQGGSVTPASQQGGTAPSSLSSTSAAGGDCSIQ